MTYGTSVDDERGGRTSRIRLRRNDTVRYFYLHEKHRRGDGLALSIEFQGDGASATKGVVQHEVQSPEIGNLVSLHGAHADAGEMITDAIDGQGLAEQGVPFLLESDDTAIDGIAFVSTPSVSDFR